jgi:hypothetical protein
MFGGGAVAREAARQVSGQACAVESFHSSISTRRCRSSDRPRRLRAGTSARAPLHVAGPAGSLRRPGSCWHCSTAAGAPAWRGGRRGCAGAGCAHQLQAAASSKSSSSGSGGAGGQGQPRQARCSSKQSAADFGRGGWLARRQRQAQAGECRRTLGRAQGRRGQRFRPRHQGQARCPLCKARHGSLRRCRHRRCNCACGRRAACPCGACWRAQQGHRRRRRGARQHRRQQARGARGLGALFRKVQVGGRPSDVNSASLMQSALHPPVRAAQHPPILSARTRAGCAATASPPRLPSSSHRRALRGPRAR